MNSSLVYCAGPDYTPEDRWQLDSVEAGLRSKGFQTYRPFRDGLDGLCREVSRQDEKTRAKTARFVFSLNLFRLIEKCEAVIFSMNGRVPDAGGIVVSAVAAMSGIPVVLHKQDHRSTFHGHDNAMITGLSPTFSTRSDLKRSIDGLMKEVSRRKKRRPGCELPPVMAEAIDLGRRLDEMLTGYRPLSTAHAEMILNKALAAYDEVTAQQPTRKDAEVPRGMVYCSGPLFCPGEVRVMSDIARLLESSGWKTYLPHRDGIEAFVMKNTDNYAANLFRPLVRFFHRLTFAVDVYYILKCDCLVFNMNGRIPDEGGVAEIGMAYAAGKPVVLYQEARGGNGVETIDPMIAAIGIQGSPVTFIDQIPGQLEQIDPARYRMADLTGKVPPHMQGMARLGQKAVRIMNRLAFIKPGSLF